MSKYVDQFWPRAYNQFHFFEFFRAVCTLFADIRISHKCLFLRNAPDVDCFANGFRKKCINLLKVGASCLYLIINSIFLHVEIVLRPCNVHIYLHTTSKVYKTPQIFISFSIHSTSFDVFNAINFEFRLLQGKPKFK